MSSRTVLTAQAFLLTDAEGNERGSFMLDHNDNPMFALRDRQGDVRARIRLAETGNPTLDFNAAGEKNRIKITLGEDDAPRLWLQDSRNASPRFLQIGWRHDSDSMTTHPAGG